MNTQGLNQKGILFFLHANSYSSGLYQPFLEPLYEDYEVWAPDLPGHGLSRWNGRIQAWTDLADYYIKHLDQNPPKLPLIGMGHSIGGIIIMLMSIQRPQWFSQVILLDPVLLPKYVLCLIKTLRLGSLTHLIPLAKAAERRKWLFSSREEALVHYSRKKVFSKWEPHFLEGYVETCLHPNTEGQYQLACAPHLESIIYQSIPLNSWKFPKKIKIPTLFLIGKYSDTVNQTGRKRLEKLGGNHVVKSIDGGHLFPFEKPAASLALIKEFLAQ